MTTSPLRQVSRDWRALCHEIGDRRAGSRGEQAAGDYLAGRFARMGLADVAQESFPCETTVRSRVDLRVRVGSAFRRVPARALMGAPSTDGARAREGRLVWIEAPEQAARFYRPSVLRGNLAVVFGSLPGDVAMHRRLVAAKPLAVVLVDDRLPFDWLKSDGVYPSWTARYGMPPTVGIPYRAGWDLKKAGARIGRIRVEVERTLACSRNVVAEIPGRRPDLPLVLVSAHHDTQCENTGADDNASGVVALMELARRLRQARPLRTVRFVSFAAEERLSFGSARYALRHQDEMPGIGVVLNLDSISSPLGHWQLCRAGSEAFGTFLAGTLARRGMDVREHDEPFPYADHFPFSAFGVPSATLMRPNVGTLIRWQHHGAVDRLGEVSATVLLHAVRGVEGVIRELTNHVRWPFPRAFPKSHREAARKVWRELFAGAGA
ncbi:MAG: M28 family metallopeptidase [Verrucomicrobiia bacterium]